MYILSSFKDIIYNVYAIIYDILMLLDFKIEVYTFKSVMLEFFSNVN